mgnify:CR=1 FL=1
MDLTNAKVVVADDPFTFDIIQNSLQAISDEMFIVMRKTAMSAIIYEVLDNQRYQYLFSEFQNHLLPVQSSA